MLSEFYWHEDVLLPFMQQAERTKHRSEIHGWISATGGLRMTSTTLKNNQELYDGAKMLAEICYFE